MRQWYENKFGYLPNKSEMVDLMLGDGYDRFELEALDHETLLETYWIEHEEEL